MFVQECKNDHRVPALLNFDSVKVADIKRKSCEGKLGTLEKKFC